MPASLEHRRLPVLSPLIPAKRAARNPDWSQYSGSILRRLNRSLPNGWRFHLPNEIYFTAEGTAFDAIGVPPDIRVPFFTPTDLQTGQDTALERAINELKH